MKAQEVMTREVVTVLPDASVKAIADLLVKHRVSALPVVDSRGNVVGIVSEGDLIRRPEIAGEPLLTWWASMISSKEARARDYVRTHGETARTVMTKDVVAVGPDTTVAEIVRLMEKHRIKRTPVVQDGALVGIVSRGDLLRPLSESLASAGAEASPDDKALQAAIERKFREQGWDTPWLNISVKDGVVRLSGIVESREIRRALEVAARGVVGVKEVKAHFSRQAGFA